MSDRSKSVATANAELDGAIGLLLAGERVESVVTTLAVREAFTQFPTGKGPFSFRLPVSGSGSVPTSAEFGVTRLSNLRQQGEMIVGFATTDGSVDDLINDTNEMIARFGFQLVGDPLFD